MKKLWLVFSTGFAFFSMFFGSGNLVFPIAVGQEGSGHYLMGTVGILLTGVIVPFLGVMGMVLHRGDMNDFFRYLGKTGTLIFSLFALSLMGPFGVLARCLTVAHGALLLITPHVPLVVTSLALCAVIFVLTINRSRVVTILGTILTPFLLLSIGAIAFFGLKNGTLPQVETGEGIAALKNGFFQGYQTMDLLAAFFFSAFVIKHLQAKSTAPLKTFFKAALIGGGMLSLVYFALVLLGGIYAPNLLNVPPQEMLGRIALESLGPLAAPFVCVAVILACLTTAIVLTTLFADFLRQHICRDKIGNKRAVFATLLIGFLVSTLQFSGIARFLGPILELIYPFLIALTLATSFHKVWQLRRARVVPA